MNKIIAICCFISLSLSVFLTSQHIGGVSVCFAQNIVERQIFEVLAENNVSGVTTKMIVYAEDAAKAREHVSLNGWKVLELKQITEAELKTFNISTGTVDTPRTVDNVEVNSPTIVKELEPILLDDVQTPVERVETPIGYPESFSGSKTYPNSEKLIEKEVLKEQRAEAARQKVIDDKRKAEELAVKKEEERKALEKSYIKRDNVTDIALMEMLPSSKELELLYTIHFNLGEIDPIDIDNETIAKLPYDQRFVVFGHTDNVNVNVNGVYKSNYELSFKRAEVIKKIMMEKGLLSDNINIVGLGTSYPKEPNKPDGNLANRRVEIYGFRAQE